MSDGNTQKFEISVSELDKFLDLAEKVIDGISKAATLTKKQRKSMRQSVGDTCEMIDSILTMVKQRISVVNKELQNDIPLAKNHISELANAWEWENKYRAFLLCEPLRTAAGELRDTVLGKFIRFFSFKNPDDLRNTIDTFLMGEQAAGEFVGELLHDLSLLADQVESRKDFVVSELEKARKSVQEYRDKFIKLEKKIRATI